MTDESMMRGGVTSTEPQPHVGEFEFPSFDVAACPYPYYAALRHEAPVYKHPDRNEYIVTRHEDIVFVAKNSELFSNAKLGEAGDSVLGQGSGDASNTPSNVFFADPPEHNRKRKLLYPAFSLERLAIYEPMIREITNSLIDSFIDRGQCDFRPDFADLLPLYLICDILGLPREDISIRARSVKRGARRPAISTRKACEFEEENERERWPTSRSRFGSGSRSRAMTTSASWCTRRSTGTGRPTFPTSCRSAPISLD